MTHNKEREYPYTLQNHDIPNVTQYFTDSEPD